MELTLKTGKDANKRYEEKIERFSVKFSIGELEIAHALKSYLEETEQSVNGYLKNLIRKDLTEKGIIDSFSD